MERTNDKVIEMPSSYSLTEGEQVAMQAFNQRVLLEKLNVYNLNTQLEQATKAVDAAQHQFNGALTLLVNSSGMTRAKLTNDFKTLVKD